MEPIIGDTRRNRWPGTCLRYMMTFRPATEVKVVKYGSTLREERSVVLEQATTTDVDPPLD